MLIFPALPTFKKVPSNKTVLAGETIRLDCAVSGEPRASLAWLKDGGNDFPAARERRMHVMTEDDVFFITNAKVHDAGVYSCSAENVVGVVRANATISVLEAPVFVKPLEPLKEVVPGTPAVLECMASGAPRPVLRWFKDGELVDGSVCGERCYFAAEGQLLVLMDAQPMDSGVYTCEIVNELGSERGRIQLAVVAQAKKVKAQFDSLSIIIIIAVACVCGTSIIWLVIIYHTKKSGGGGTVNNNNISSNNSTLTAVLGDGQRGEYARTSLLAVSGGGGMGGPMLNGGETLYLQQQHPDHLSSWSGSPVRMAGGNRGNEQLLPRAGRGELDYDEERISCKDSGNGDSAKERNPTSSEDEEEEDDERIELKCMRSGGGDPISIQRNRLHEYLGGGEVVGGMSREQLGKNSNYEQQQGGGMSTFKRGRERVGSRDADDGLNTSSLSNKNNLTNSEKVAFVATT